ncbi:gamma-butyrobetaine hydroxylase-like domain-containing protein [Aestuariivirga sp.]|uniref:gamma-butyrobetaine hydroxylase-like domain-containing protein n=1 Tax=Aestuariivirga sp. TaxID=2650926 RepID=UPI00391C4785
MSDPSANDPWPQELRLASNGAELRVSFDTGEELALSAEYLRVESPSAEVKGHGPGQEQLVWGKRNVRIRRLEPVGSYAVRIVFDDGHSTGLYTWPYLLKLGREKDTIWRTYLDKLAAAGFSRG